LRPPERRAGQGIGSAGHRHHHLWVHGGVRAAAALVLCTVAATLAGCSLFSTPTPAPVTDPGSLAPAGPVGYVVCSDAVTPVELDTHTAEPQIPLPIRGTPVIGNFAIATSANGRWAYVVTSDGVEPSPSAGSTSVPPATSHTAATTATTTPSGVAVQNVVIPINLVTQKAEAPIKIPGQGGTHAVVVMPGDRIVLAASGSTIVPVDVATDKVGTPLDLGPVHTIFGMALDPTSTTLYALVAGGVFPVDTANATAGVEIATGLSVSSVYSPHGIAVTADGKTVYVVGQGGTDFGGRVLPIAAATGTTQTPTGFDRYGIADPAAVAISADGSLLLVADAANNWINPVPLATFADPPAPVRLPQRSAGVSSGTGHPTDIVIGPGDAGAFVVVGFDAVVPFQPASDTFGHPISVCSGASSMTVAPAP
jgi:hypothetical protein